MALGTWTLFQQLNPPPKSFSNKVQEFKGVSILKPLKGADPALFQNLETFFKMECVIAHELLFSIESSEDPAHAIVIELMQRYPKVSSRLFTLKSADEKAHIKNPKIRNISTAFDEAKFDLMWISDSNVRVRATELDYLVSLFDKKTGMVTSIVAGVDFKGIGGALESVFLGTFYARFMALCNRFAKPCVVGKSMLFRKSDTLRFGGLKCLAEFLAEDFMAGEAMRKLGLQIKTSKLTVLQVLGQYSFQSFWKRHLRWGRIRKAHAPIPFLLEPFFGPIMMSVCGAFALSQIKASSFGAGFLSSIAFLCFLDSLSYFKVVGLKLNFILYFPVVWFARECLSIPLWIQIASSNKIDWRGNRFTLARGGLLGEK